MKIDIGNAAIMMGVTVILLNIFFNEVFMGWNTPVILIALGLVLFALLRRNEKDNK